MLRKGSLKCTNAKLQLRWAQWEHLLKCTRPWISSTAERVHTQKYLCQSSIYLLLSEGLTPALLAMWGCYKIHKNSTNRGSGNGIISICKREKKLFCDNEIAPSNKKSKTIIVTYKIALNNFYLKLMNHTSKSFRDIYEYMYKIQFSVSILCTLGEKNQSYNPQLWFHFLRLRLPTVNCGLKVIKWVIPKPTAGKCWLACCSE